MSVPLAGRTIVVTRPSAQAGGLAAGVVAAGGAVVLFPLLEISPLEDDSSLEHGISLLDDAGLAIFISTNAVDFSVPAILARRGWPLSLPVAAVGKGTERQLVAAGFDRVLVPSEQFDSEGLLALPELSAAQIAGKKVLLFKGEGGRDLLATALAQRGATVIPVPCYKRLPPSGDLKQLVDLFVCGRLDAIVVSSSEAMRHLSRLLVDGFHDEGRRLLDEVLVVVPHPRIAETASVVCRNVLITSSGDDGILAGLVAYNWSLVRHPIQ